MVGIPYENAKKILDTIKLNALLKPDAIQTWIFYPFKGTKLHELCKEEGFLTGKTMPNVVTDSMCKYPNLTRQQIRMFCHYFKKFVDIYSYLKDRKSNLSKTL